MIKIIILWNDQRNIDRVIKWLGLDCNFYGSFRNNKYCGYKTASENKLIFNIRRLDRGD